MEGIIYYLVIDKRFEGIDPKREHESSSPKPERSPIVFSPRHEKGCPISRVFCEKWEAMQPTPKRNTSTYPLPSRLPYRLRKRTRLPRLPIQMHRRNLAGRSHLLRLGIRHLVHKANHLLADFQNPRSHFNHVARHQLALVANVLLHPGHTELPFPQIRRRNSHRSKQIPVRLIELAHVPGNVHVADLIALPRIRRPAVSHHARA